MKYFVIIVKGSLISLFSKRDTLYNSIGTTSGSYCNNLRDTLYICIERKRIKRYNIYVCSRILNYAVFCLTLF